MAKYLKLGLKASVFYDPSTQKKVLPGQIVKFSSKELKSERIINAITGHHLVQVEADELKEYQSANSAAEPKATKSPEPELEEEDGDEEELSKLTVAQLIDRIETDYDLDDEELARVKKLKKPELIQYYTELLAEEEEDVEEEEED